MRQAVHRRAQHALADFRLRSGLPAFGGHPGRQAERRSIVVIFASMYERAVVVVADGPALAQLSAAGVAPIEAAVMEGIAGGTPCEGMCQAVSITAEAMSAICPPSGGGLDLAGSTVRILD